jgi:uncharacterized protein YdaU (DUF1376 family)
VNFQTNVEKQAPSMPIFNQTLKIRFSRDPRDTSGFRPFLDAFFSGASQEWATHRCTRDLAAA